MPEKYSTAESKVLDVCTKTSKRSENFLSSAFEDRRCFAPASFRNEPRQRTSSILLCSQFKHVFFLSFPSVRQGSRMSILATTLSYSWYFPRVPFPYQHYSGSFLLFLSTYVEVTCSLLEGSTSSRACYSLLPRDFCGTPYI